MRVRDSHLAVELLLSIAALQQVFPTVSGRHFPLDVSILFP